MSKSFHEIRDPIHVFVRLDTDERRVVDSRAFQRLRHVHQLGMTFLVYPGATHRRFEHCLGVMELAGRVYDVITDRRHLRNLEDVIGVNDTDAARLYWRRALRIAALCHDIGHLPFSHAAEDELLPSGWDHERITREVIQSSEITGILSGMRPVVDPVDVVKLALGPKKASDLTFTTWETILAEIIVGDAFGVDRMDYLLRDSHHSGVAYGRFDHYRLVDTLRILQFEDREPCLGVEEGGLQSAEGLMLARYFMFSQLYYHHIRRIYDIHLKDFLKASLPDSRFSTVVADHLRTSDNDILAAIHTAADESGRPGHEHAKRLIERSHFRLVYERNPVDFKVNPESGRAIFAAAVREFDSAKLRHDRIPPKGGLPDFPVRMRDERIVSSLSLSQALSSLPLPSVDYIFADPSITAEFKQWLDEKRPEIIAPPHEDDNG